MTDDLNAILSARQLVKINHDDKIEDVIDKLNKILHEEIGCSFIDDGEQHDGFCVYEFVQTGS